MFYPSAPAKTIALRWWWWARARTRILIPAAIGSFILFITFFSVMTSSPKASMAYTAPQIKSDLPKSFDSLQDAISKLDSWDPQRKVAFAIPVGGRTERSKQLDSILQTLLSNGALASSVFVFEDVLGRPGQQGFTTVAEVAAKRGVHVIPSYVCRNDGENANNFGIHLARHYHFFLDYLLAPPATEEEINAPNACLDETVRKSRPMRAAHPFEFVVVIEDDLQLAEDFVKFFFSMARVMKIDPTIYCVSAHQDNAFLGVHRDDSINPNYRALASDPSTSLDPLGFDFRRGNHFMAPGWMTSQINYNSIVRPKWLDLYGNYAYASELHLKNGHWDRFFDSLTQEKDCIFPEIPRITHQGADGFTVSKRGQMELYSNLRLSELDVDIDYGDLSRLTDAGYTQSIYEFISHAQRLIALDQIRPYRDTKLIYIVDARSDKDDEWNVILNQYFGVIGVGGYGGWPGYVKVRGIYKGVVFIRWLTNLVLLVGEYSPFHQAALDASEVDYSVTPTLIGCFKDEMNRDLPQYLPYLHRGTVTSKKCLISCNNLGYQYAGLQLGSECWCGNSYNNHGEASSSECDVPCIQTPSGEPTACGGGFRNSVYTNQHSQTKSVHQTAQRGAPDVQFVSAKSKQTCDDACAVNPNGYTRCDERFFPLMHRSCAILKSIFSVDGVDTCATCADEENPEIGFATPARIENEQKCLFSRARYHRCNWEPPSNTMLRACACVK